MATVNFSVPDEVKELFNTAFAGVNRSAVIAELMRQAAANELKLRRRRRAVDDLLASRPNSPPVDRERIEKALQELRC